MTAAMFRVMLLTLRNDRGALVMAFVLPVLFFLVMAEIFSSTSGGPIQLRVAFANEVQDELSMRLIAALQSGESLEIVGEANNTREKVEALVAKGTADAGIILPSGARTLDDIGGLGTAPILLITDPVRSVTMPMLSGQIQKAYFEALPDIALGSVVTVIEDQFVELNDDQRADIAAGLVELRNDARAGLQIRLFKGFGIFGEGRYTYFSPEYDDNILGAEVKVKTDSEVYHALVGIAYHF